MTESIAKHTKVDMIWVAGRSPILVSHSLRGVAMNLKATTLTYLAIVLKGGGKTSFMDQFNNSLQQQMGCLDRENLSFSKT